MDISRRDFVRSVTAAGAGIAMARRALAEEAAAPAEAVDTLNIGIIGVGEQGRKALIESSLPIPGIRFKAVCDIWDYNRKIAVRYLKKNGHEVSDYEDYREMLANEKDLDAVLVASPDWMHAEHAIACMEAGLHVYCEKEMSNDLEKAKQMVLFSRRTKRLLQIGHQRRSNPRYIHAIDKLIHGKNLLGRVTHANAQWNRAKAEDLGWPYEAEIAADKLAKYGYNSMHEFRNWRWYKKYGGGPIVDLGSHQIDLFEWVFDTQPKSVIASGGIDYYHHHQWYDNVMCIYEYENEQGTARAFYQTLTTSSHGGNAETFMGVNGTLLMSEVANRGNAIEREAHAPDWTVLANRGLLAPVSTSMVTTETKNTVIDVRETPDLPKWPLPIELAKLPHQPHLENFFGAIRNGTKLNCPGELGYQTAAAVLAVNEAVRTNRKIEFKKSDFAV